VTSVQDKPSGWRDVSGYVMAHSGGPFVVEVEVCGSHLGDWSIAGTLDPATVCPAFMVWEGHVTLLADDVSCIGEWRRATAAEIIAVHEGRNPFQQRRKEQVFRCDRCGRTSDDYDGTCGVPLRDADGNRYDCRGDMQPIGADTAEPEAGKGEE